MNIGLSEKTQTIKILNKFNSKNRNHMAKKSSRKSYSSRKSSLNSAMKWVSKSTQSKAYKAGNSSVKRMMRAWWYSASWGWYSSSGWGSSWGSSWYTDTAPGQDIPDYLRYTYSGWSSWSSSSSNNKVTPVKKLGWLQRWTNYKATNAKTDVWFTSSKGESIFDKDDLKVGLLTKDQNKYGRVNTEWWTSAQFDDRDDKAAQEALAAGKTASEYLSWYEWYTASSAEDKANTEKAMAARMGAFDSTEEEDNDIRDLEWDVMTAEQIQLVKEKDQAEAEANRLNDINTENTRIANENAGIASSEKIEQSAHQLEALIQQSSYLWQRGQPWVSSVHLNAIGKQIGMAQTTFSRLKQMESNSAQMRRLWVEFDAEKFEQQMTALQDKLDQQVWQLTQQAINMFNAEWEEIDTMEELQMVKNRVIDDLDASIANIAISNRAAREYIMKQANEEIAMWEQYVKNKNIVNEQTSKAQKFYVDGNGEFMTTPWWDKIPYASELTTHYDSKTWTLISYDPADPQWTFKSTQLWDWSETWLTIDQLDTASKTADRMGMWLQEYLVSIGKMEAPKTWRQWNNYNSVDEATLETKSAEFFADPAYAEWTVLERWECWEFGNDYLERIWVQAPWDANLITNTREEKQNIINSQDARIWSLAIIKSSTKPDNWHVGIVTWINDDGSVNIVESNWDWDQTVHTRNQENGKALRPDQIEWYFDPTVAQPETWGSTATSGVDRILWGIVEWSMKYSDLVKKLKSLWMKWETKTNIANSITEQTIGKYLNKNSTMEDIHWVYIQLDNVFDDSLTQTVFYELIADMDNALPYIIGQFSDKDTEETMIAKLEYVINEETDKDTVRDMIEDKWFSKWESRRIRNALN